jgi:lysozyme
MKRLGTALIAAVLIPVSLSAGASAQALADFPGLSDSLAAIRDSAKTQKARGREEVLHGVMGADRFQIEALLSASARPDVSPYFVRGADISHYQGDIAWDLVKTSGLSFVYMKATEGSGYTDATFAQNWAGASDAGLSKGAYHFYDFCLGGAVQADHFISVVPAEAGALPPTLDLERSSSCSKMPSRAAFLKQLDIFVAKIHRAYGHSPILYVNGSIYAQYLKGATKPYKIWIADTSHTAPSVPDSGAWTMWQYDWHGAVAGIPGEVDLNVFNGTPLMLAQLAGSSDVMVASLP